MEGKIIFGSHEIVFRVKFANRKTLGIKVYPAGNVEVLAPIDTTIAAIEQRVYRRAQWILRQQNYFKELGERSPDKRFISGESHYYLGRQFLLRVERESLTACDIKDDILKLYALQKVKQKS